MCEFRPCIDIHAGIVKQIVGSTLTIQDKIKTNFETNKSPAEFAQLYKSDDLKGGHVIMLGNSKNNINAALKALNAYPNGLQVGGGISNLNCKSFIDAGASHVIVTSYIFNNSVVDFSKLKLLGKIIGKEKLVLDLSCRKKPLCNIYFVVTDRWQTFTDLQINKANLQLLSKYCDEFLVHGVDVEGKRCGVLEDLIEILVDSPIPVTYAGGVRSLEDLEIVKSRGMNKVNVSVGSALNLFGGDLEYNKVVEWSLRNQQEAKQK